jgi:hypothetical protein
MKDSNTPATKADIRVILGKIDGIDAGLNRKLDEFRAEMNGKFHEFRGEMTGRFDELRGEMNERLDEIDRHLQVLIEQSHIGLGQASHDAEEVLKDHDQRLEKRVARLEWIAGIAAA